MRVLVPALALVAMTASALGADNPATRQAPPGLLWFIVLGPLVLVFLLLGVVVWNSTGRKRRADLAKADEHRNVRAEHMASLERKCDRMIELLESIDRKLGDDS